MAWSDNLRGHAKNIASSTAQTIRVQAGPGTGKSFALKRRIQRLLEEDVNPERILAVTFTRNAARSLKEDLHSLHVEGCEEIRATTLHAFAFSILCREQFFDFLGRKPRPLVAVKGRGLRGYEYSPMFQDIIHEGTAKLFGTARDCDKRVKAFEAAWAKLQHDEPGWPIELVDQEFHDALISWLKFHEGILIGELIPLAVQYLRDNPCASETTWFDHILVDEYQDLNKAEQTLIDLISAGKNVIVVGDVDQSIYRFRHAHPEGILEFNRTHQNTIDMPLQECRRCPVNVVKLADQLICNNHPQCQKPVLTPLSTNLNGEIVIVQWDSPKLEADGLSTYCSNLILHRGYLPSDILILTPREVLACAICQELKDRDLPVHSFYHDSLLSNKYAQRSFSLLKLNINRCDRIALRFLLGYNNAEYRAKPYSALMSFCKAQHISPWDALSDVVDKQTKITGVNSGLLGVFKQIREELQLLSNMSFNEQVDFLFPPNEDWTSEVRAFISGMETDSIEKVYEAVVNFITQPESPEQGEFIAIMSLHKSKGLTSRVVIISGCCEGIIPTISESDDDPDAALAEQRRLFYVALTRCTETVVMSSFINVQDSMAKQNGILIRDGKTITTTFIKELGRDVPRPVQGKQWLKTM